MNVKSSELGSVFLLGLVMGIIGASAATVNHYRFAAIEMECAAYDQKTGEWHWLNESKE